ncbi:UNVERIFIED_CONTAM: hypothetical protein FKN15_009635 [Acipenser sinensis]
MKLHITGFDVGGQVAIGFSQWKNPFPQDGCLSPSLAQCNSEDTRVPCPPPLMPPAELSEPVSCPASISITPVPSYSSSQETISENTAGRNLTPSLPVPTMFIKTGQSPVTYPPPLCQAQHALNGHLPPQSQSRKRGKHSVHGGGHGGRSGTPQFFMAGSSPPWGSGHSVATPGEAGSLKTPGDGSSSGPSGGDGSSSGPSGGDGSSSGPSGGDGSSSGPSGGDGSSSGPSGGDGSSSGPSGGDGSSSGPSGGDGSSSGPSGGDGSSSGPSGGDGSSSGPSGGDGSSSGPSGGDGSSSGPSGGDGSSSGPSGGDGSSSGPSGGDGSSSGPSGGHTHRQTVTSSPSGTLQTLP